MIAGHAAAVHAEHSCRPEPTIAQHNLRVPGWCANGSGDPFEYEEPAVAADARGAAVAAPRGPDRNRTLRRQRVRHEIEHVDVRSRTRGRGTKRPREANARSRPSALRLGGPSPAATSKPRCGIAASEHGAARGTGPATSRLGATAENVRVQQGTHKTPNARALRLPPRPTGPSEWLVASRTSGHPSPRR